MLSYYDNTTYEELKHRANDGDIFSSYLLSWANLSNVSGFDVSQDYEAGVRGLKEVWRNGGVDAGYKLYTVYLEGVGVKKDLDVAYDYLIASAENGFPKSQQQLGYVYSGRSYPRILDVSYEDSVLWFSRAASQGDKLSAVNLSGLYHRGSGVRQDDQKAFEWISKVEELPYGDPMDGFSGLAKVYEEGIGTDVDLVQAYKYYDLLSPGSAPDKARLEEQMTPEQIQEAIRLSRQWQEEQNIFVPSYYGLEYQEDGTFQ
ncbi:tetratricopeptide repeat protein [Halomonas sp.]|uniref:tetratricopeptide repeat protein n=1 Tax=Halomonas sp. TaxID=1486246 RepID=UPI00257C02A6|nr:tetratricopeptide repeat protein [Halomonas sp.]MCJ8284118.1 sel1 repeat family protein [Halomonas sp.]NQY69171.1 sel1 repeat family protein [Halomonas sp.]